VNDLHRVVAWQWRGRESNPQPADCKSDVLTTTPSSYTTINVGLVNINPSNLDNFNS